MHRWTVLMELYLLLDHQGKTQVRNILLALPSQVSSEGCLLYSGLYDMLYLWHVPAERTSHNKIYTNKFWLAVVECIKFLL